MAAILRSTELRAADDRNSFNLSANFSRINGHRTASATLMKPFKAEDLLLHRTIGTLASNPDQNWLIFSVNRALQEADDYESTLWGIRIGEDKKPRQVTSSAFAASAPMLKGDGTMLAFLSARADKGGKQVHLLQLDGGEATQLTHANDERLSSIHAWSPDGRSLLVTASVKWIEDGEDKHEWKVGRPPQVARFLPYKQDGAGITVGKRIHLYAVDVESGDMRALTSGDFKVSSGAWSPDGQRLSYVRKRDGRQRHRTDLWIARADGSDARLLLDSLASISAQAWSPDGRRLALAASQIEGDSMVGLWMVNAESGELQRIGGEDFELGPSSTIEWHPDGERLAVVADTRGLEVMAIVDVAKEEVLTVKKGLRNVQGIAQCGDRLAFVASSMRKLEEVFSMDWNGQNEQRHSALNRAWFKERARPHVVKRRFVVPDGDGGTERIDAWLLRPAEGDGPFPLLVDMHGGPHSTVLVDFTAHTYWYLLLSRGWAILAPNAVGSSSYGQAFAKRLRGRWGELDLPQYEAVIRMLQYEGLADDRIACAGKSYGGFLGAWAIGHSDLFKAAAIAAPVANIESHAGTSDTGYYVTPFSMKADMAEGRDTYHRLSPVAHCAHATTATLILQGENDGRCPRGQSEELFANLIRCSEAPVELVVYPSSTHSEAESGKPSNRIDYHRRLAEWVQRHAG